MFKLELKVTEAEWMKLPAIRWNAGLERAGLEYRQQLQPSGYPPKPPNSSYARKGAAGGITSKANFKIITRGKEMEFGGPYYLKFLLFGTGLFGPTGALIYPKVANFLVWMGSGGQLVRRRSVAGTVWPGKKENIVEALTKGFIRGVKEFKS